MDTNEDLLDTPLEEGISKANGGATHTSIRMLKLDLGVSAVLVVLSLLGGLSAIFDTGLIIIVMICVFFLGCYQLLSALIGGIRGNRKKLIYLAVALLYLLVFFGGFDLINDTVGASSSQMIYLIGLILIPLTFALYYTKLCYDTLKAQSSYD
jgi:hypothetical protein